VGGARASSAPQLVAAPAFVVSSTSTAVTGVSQDFAELSATLQQADERTVSLQARATAIDKLVQDGDLTAISPTAESLDLRLGQPGADEEVERQLSALAKEIGDAPA
jgi:phage shock protein A